MHAACHVAHGCALTGKVVALTCRVRDGDGTLQSAMAIGAGMKNVDETRRRFVAAVSAIGASGLGATLLPGVLWAQVQQSGEARVTADMLKDALAIAGLEFTEDDRTAM